MQKRAVTQVAVVVMCAVAVSVLAWTLARTPPSEKGPAGVPGRPVVRGGNVAALAAAPHLLFKRMAGIDRGGQVEIAPLGDPEASRGTTSLECDRLSFAAGRGICLQAHQGVTTTFEAVIFDARFQPLTTLKLEGTPTRTRISPDGRFGAITVFLTGAAHGYKSVSFSTKTTLIDMATGAVRGDLEQFTATRDGQPFAAADFNFWGVTFAQDNTTFYATLMTNRKTYLVRGDVEARTLVALRENVECPSLSPDNRLLGYKKRVGGDLEPWRFYVMDLATMTERPIAGESRSIDDQLEWLDDGHVLYGAPRSSQSAVVDVWVAPVEGTGPARPFLPEASSPVVIRRL